MNTRKIIILLVVLLLLIVIFFSFFTIYNTIQNDINGKNQDDYEYTLIIESSDFESQVAQMLYDNNIIINTKVWTYWLNRNYSDLVYINGEYYINSNMSYEELAQKLQNPDISHKTVSVCIPEGYNCIDIANRLEEYNICSADAFLEVCKSTDEFNFEWLEGLNDNDLIAYKLEGFLFPATYDFGENSDPVDIVQEMLETFDYHITDEMTAFCEENNMTLYELITLASVVQEEALDTDSASNIASVFINRLNNGAKLQSDVTYYYAASLRDDYGFSQEVYDAYYTYRCDGLPVGAISNCGDEILSATVNYEKTDYLYFFSDLNQEFHFATTYDEFLSLQEEYPWK